MISLLPYCIREFLLFVDAGVPGGPIVARVTIEVEVVGSNLTREILKDQQAESARA